MSRLPACLVLASLLLPGARALADATGRVSFLEGSARREVGGQGSALKEGDAVAAGDTLATAPKSRLEVLLEDGSVIRLGPESRLEVTELAFLPEQETVSTRLRLALGSLWAKVHKLGDGGKFEVATERAVAGVRGTEFRVDASGESGGVEVYEGKVHVLDNAIAMREVPVGDEQYALAGPHAGPAPGGLPPTVQPAAPPPPPASRAPRAPAKPTAQGGASADVAEREVRMGGAAANAGAVAPAQKEFDVTPGQRLELAGHDPARLGTGHRQDELAQFFRSRELPKRERFFHEHERREKPAHEKHERRRERRADRLERQRRR